MEEIITVIGGGHGGHAISADLSLAGLNVRFYEHPDYVKHIDKVFVTQEIEISGVAETGVAKLSMVTSNIDEAMSGAKYIIMSIPAFCHKMYAELIADYVEDEQIIVLLPGTFGSLVFNTIFEKKGINKNIVIAETNSLPYDTRLLAPGEVHVYGLNAPLNLGVFPSSKTTQVLQKLNRFYHLKASIDVIDCGLTSLNPVAHTPGCILNAGRIERSRGEFWLYEEGVTPCVARVMEVLDKERLSIVKIFGYEPVPFADAHAEGREPRTIWEEINSNIKLTPIKGPTSIYNRYFTEDIPFGLVPWSRIADIVGINTPVMDSLINIGSIIIEEDAWKIGRKLEDLGICGMSIDEIKLFAMKGNK